MRIESDELIFSSGKRVDVSCGIIGIAPDDRNSIYGGRDDYFYATDLTPDEAEELADYMLRFWLDFKIDARLRRAPTP